MKASKDIAKISRYLAELDKTERSFKDIFLSVFSEKDKIMFTKYGDQEPESFTYGQIEKAIYSASEEILKETKGENLGSWIAVNAEDKVLWVISFWATLLSGYKAFLFNPNHTSEINDFNIKTLNVEYAVGDTPVNGVAFILLNSSGSSDKADLSHFENEIALSSSGSSSASKVAVYTGQRTSQNFDNYLYVIKKDHNFIYHKGEQHSQLVILPFFHIFGFVLVFMWYSFSHSLFVIPKDLTTQSIQPIFKKEDIRMILSVPLLFELVSDKLHNTAKKQGKEKKLSSLLEFNNRIQSKFPHFGTWLVRNITAKGIRKKVFGTTTTVLGIGGAKISKQCLETFNGLGYRAINGYGTTELSIFLAAYGCNVKALNKGTIGNDTWRGKYRFGEKGELSLCLPNSCNYVLENGQKRIIDIETFVETGDIAHEEDGYLFIDAREDDLLVLPNGEKVYPNIVESYFEFLGANQFRVLNFKNKVVLVTFLDKNESREKIYQRYSQIKEANKRIPMTLRVQEIRRTSSPLPLSLKQEVSRMELTRLMQKYPDNYPFMSMMDAKSEEVLVNQEYLKLIKSEVSSILKIDNPETINDDADFFTDLGGDSISFMELCSRLNEKGSFNPDKIRAMSLTSIKEMALQYNDNLSSKGKEERV